MEEKRNLILLGLSKRLIQLIFELWIVMTFLFIIIRVLPGDPIYLLFPRGVDPEVAQQWKELLGWDKPLYIQYLVYLKDTFTGDLGIGVNYAQGISISALVRPYFLKTIFLIGVSMFFSVFLGFMLGKIAAKNKEKFSDRIITTFGIILFSISSPVLALTFIMIFANLVPNWTFWGTVSDNFGELSVLAKIVDVFQHALLPLLVLTIACFSMFLLMVKNRFTNNFTNTILSFPWMIPILVGWLIINTFLIENIFTYKGLGYLFWESLCIYDLPLMQAVIFLFFLFVIITTFIIDIFIILRESGQTILKESEDKRSVSLNQNTKFRNLIKNTILSKKWCLEIWREFRKSKFALIAFCLLFVILIIALIGPYIAPENPNDPNVPESYLPQPPSSRHIFGTDFADKDIFSQFLWGARSPVIIALVTIITSVILGSIIGIHINKIKKDRFLGAIAYEISERLIIVFSIFPIFLLLFVFTLIYGRFYMNHVLIISVFIWFPAAWVVKLTINRNYEKGHMLDFKNSMTIAIPSVLSITKFLVIIAIISVLILEFIGLGSPTNPSWGWMLERAHSYNAMLNNWWWWILPPIIGIILLCFSLYLVMDRLESSFRAIYGIDEK